MPTEVGSAADAGNTTAAPASGGAPATAAPALASQQQLQLLQQRLSNTTASLPIVYGSIAFYLGKKADELQTHEWTLFLRGPNPHDDHLNSRVISKVVFQLHPSFAQPTRELTEPPYEVTERGWGEFEAQIRIHWKDPSEQTTIVNHTIKLYPQGSPPTSGSNKDVLQQSTEVPVLAENYDEVVFTDPSESFFRSLTQITAVPEGPLEEIASFASAKKGVDAKLTRLANSSVSSSWKQHLTLSYSDQEDFLALIAAQKFLQDELAGVKERFRQVNEDLTIVDQKLALAQQQKQREAAAAAVRGSSSSSGDRKRTKKARPGVPNKKARTTGGKTATSSGGGTKRGGSTTSTSTSIKTSTKTVKSATTKASAPVAGGASATKKGNTSSGGVASSSAKK